MENLGRSRTITTTDAPKQRFIVGLIYLWDHVRLDQLQLLTRGSNEKNAEFQVLPWNSSQFYYYCLLTSRTLQPNLELDNLQLDTCENSIVDKRVHFRTTHEDCIKLSVDIGNFDPICALVK